MIEKIGAALLMLNGALKAAGLPSVVAVVLPDMKSVEEFNAMLDKEHRADAPYLSPDPLPRPVKIVGVEFLGRR
jgi:hypothetical protein